MQTIKELVIIWIEPDKEPTKHIFNDLPLLKTELDAWGGYFLFLSDSDQNVNSFNPRRLKGLACKLLISVLIISSKYLKKSVKLSEPADIRLAICCNDRQEWKYYFHIIRLQDWNRGTDIEECYT